MRLQFVLLFVFLQTILYSQVTLPAYPDSLFGTYYWQRASLFESLPKKETDILFVGNSITDGGEWSELFDDQRIKNRGISGDVTAGVLHRLPAIAKGKPAKVFFLIGTNDISRGIATDSVVRNIWLAVDYLHAESPLTTVYVQSILPVNDVYKKFSGHTSRGDSIRKVNQTLERFANVHQYTFINIHDPFCDANGKMDVRYTNDGLHLLGEGYLFWKHLVFPHIYGVNEKPALIPQPKQVQWNKGRIALRSITQVNSNDPLLANEAILVQQLFKESGFDIAITTDQQPGEFAVVLRVDPRTTNNEQLEQYTLRISENNIELVAASAHGIFNGIQTLRQLMRDHLYVPACAIEDAPAFSWRGYMIDVGRNYMPLSLLKQQLDVMAAYKLNVFHFHPTEDIAWRLQTKCYPQLTEPEHMLRNKGQYYTIDEMKELIAYAKQRHMQFVLEVDMPGHSAAFKRAMGTDMQSEAGKEMVRTILQEICNTYDLTYIHIGSDEVRISDTSFVPGMTHFLEQAGKKVIGWQPGGNFTTSTIRQLWREDNDKSFSKLAVPFVDSKHLYLNHMDPLEAVVTIFNRQLAKRVQGDSLALGATLCVWHDRAIAVPEDVLRMNPVYPGMVTFSERSWQGGGQTNWTGTINGGDPIAFSAFETKLLEHRDLYFSSLPFPYVPQAKQSWELVGPYSNEGDVTKNFPIEKSLNAGSVIAPTQLELGGTIILRHWWWPWISGALKDPQENTTWYARTKIWSDQDRIGNFWIGFYNMSRSPATDSPPVNAWDHKVSKLWVNNSVIDPPHWAHANQTGHAEIPLVDEGYEYRTPTAIALKKGWNTVVVKAPVGSFKARAAQHPTKWMFSFVEVK
jgi:hexosaminidase